MADRRGSPERSESSCSKAKKFKGSFSYNTKYNENWFEKENLKEYKDIVCKSKLGDNYFFCQVCNKDVSCSHGGSSDLVRHCASVTHNNRLKEKRQQPTIAGFAMVKNSSLDEQTRIAEIKLTGFLAEHNLPMASADHLTALVKKCFPDSKIAKSYACSRTKTSCILNGAIFPDLKERLVEDMKTSIFSLSTDGSNDQNLDKMNH